MADVVYLTVRCHNTDHILKMRGVYLKTECLISRLKNTSEYLTSDAFLKFIQYRIIVGWVAFYLIVLLKSQSHKSHQIRGHGRIW